MLWDKDKVTADNVIGSVVCDLHPLLSRSASEIDGWFPVMDSLRGVCGQLRAVVKMTLLIDHNPREVNSGLMRLMTSPTLPDEERLQRVVGLVSYLVCCVDPDSETKNSFRSERVSNVQRMKVFQRLHGEARRGLCQRAAQLGANAVLSFCVSFDLEDNMLVARASGSAVMCKRVRLDDTNSQASSKHSPLSSPRTKPHAATSPALLPLTLEPIVEDAQPFELNTKVTSEQDVLFSAHNLKAKTLGLLSLHEMHGHDVHLLTCSQLPQGWVEAVGGMVAARSVR